MKGYVPGGLAKDDTIVKLNANENNYPPSAEVVTAITAELQSLSRYPETSARLVREAAARVYGVAPDEVMVTNGSDEMLRILLQACADENEKVVSFWPSYTYYETLARIQNVDYKLIEFGPDFSLPRELPVDGARLVFLPNPNAQSGTLFSEAEILRLCDATSGLVVIDEAYADFAGFSMISKIRSTPNLVVTRTFSKSYSLAGMRLGLGFASSELMLQFDKVRDFYNVDRLAQVAALAALNDQETLKASTAKIVATRQRLARELELRGIFVFPSWSNFLLARFGQDEARSLFMSLQENDILVRYFDAPRLSDCLRITIGTDAEIDKLLDVLDSL